MEENSHKKTCPFCGAEINANAKKCRYCNNWIDEEIECPYCAEKIKASAKKCRYCGEWLDKNEDNDFTKKSKTDLKNSEKLSLNNLWLIFGAIFILLISSILVWRLFFYIPSCSNQTILSKLEMKVRDKFPDISSLNFDKENIKTLSKQEKGYSCSVSADADNAPLTLEYTYNKISITDYNFSTKVVLPDCYNGSIKTILSELIKKSDYMNFKDNVSIVNINHASVENYDKEIPKYSCQADISLVAKPGRAFVLNFWDVENADNNIDCKVNYESLFCGNGYTTCASLNQIFNCKYKED